MDYFTYKEGVAYCEELSLAELADRFGTPAYIYSATTLTRHCQALRAAFAAYPTLPCFAVKANSNLSVLKTIFAQGYGADLVSLGELERALLAGARPEQIVFSGVGKQEDEIRRALAVGIFSFNVESRYELETLSQQAAAAKKVARLCLRVNPNIDAKTNPKIATGLYSTKFGLAEVEAEELMAKALHDPHIKLVGLACHIGSQITEIEPLKDAAERMATITLKAQARGHALEFLNMGGGLGIRYKDETPPTLEEYAQALIAAVRKTGLRLLIEPGRILVGNMGVLLTRVIGVKSTPVKHFVVVDAAMNDLLRPTLYNSFHDILPVQHASQNLAVNCDFVGPICETGDYLGKDRQVPLPQAGALYYVRGCGAYAASMASQYNTRPRAPEILVSGKNARVIRPRERLAALWEDELKGL